MFLKRVEIKITGRVQGVFFRQAAKSKADELGLAGFVKNESDGSVRIIAEGEENQLQKLIEWAKVGTEFTKVEQIDIIRKEATGELDSFSIVD